MQALDKQKSKQVKNVTDSFTQTLNLIGQVTDYDVNKIVKQHNERMQDFEGILLEKVLFKRYTFSIILLIQHVCL